jgi:hypothetical protein
MTTTSMKIVVLVPAHDEAPRVGQTVEAALSIAGVDSVVVIDDGSRDDTAEIAERAGATVVRSANNLGKGAALDLGAQRAVDADVLLLLDADLGQTASQGELLLEPVLAGQADMAIATFPSVQHKAGFGLVKSLARWGISKLGGGFDAQAPLSGQRALNRAAVDAVRPFSTGYGVEVATTVRALRSGLRLIEVPTAMAHAATGRDVSGFVHRGRQFAHVALALVKLAAQRSSGRPSNRG